MDNLTFINPHLLLIDLEDIELTLSNISSLNDAFDMMLANDFKIAITNAMFEAMFSKYPIYCCAHSFPELYESVCVLYNYLINPNLLFEIVDEPCKDNNLFDDNFMSFINNRYSNCISELKDYYELMWYRNDVFSIYDNDSELINLKGNNVVVTKSCYSVYRNFSSLNNNDFRLFIHNSKHNTARWISAMKKKKLGNCLDEILNHRMLLKAIEEDRKSPQIITDDKAQDLLHAAVALNNEDSNKLYNVYYLLNKPFYIVFMNENKNKNVYHGFTELCLESIDSNIINYFCKKN